MKNYSVENIHISQVKTGDTIEHLGEFKTITKGNLKYSDFMGYTLFGDSYNLGTKQVKKVTFHIIKK